MKNRNLALILAVLLGTFGAHKFYLKKPIWGVVYLLFCWTLIPTVIGIIEGLIMAFMSQEAFDRKYNNKLSVLNSLPVAAEIVEVKVEPEPSPIQQYAVIAEPASLPIGNIDASSPPVPFAESTATVIENANRALANARSLKSSKSKVERTYYVVGVRHYDYKKVDMFLTKGSEVSLVRELDNIYDSNAIKVIFKDKQIGYLSAKDAKTIAIFLDDEEWTVQAKVDYHFTDGKLDERILLRINYEMVNT